MSSQKIQKGEIINRITTFLIGMTIFIIIVYDLSDGRTHVGGGRRARSHGVSYYEGVWAIVAGSSMLVPGIFIMAWAVFKKHFRLVLVDSHHCLFYSLDSGAGIWGITARKSVGNRSRLDPAVTRRLSKHKNYEGV
jgi:hypothetical protein